MPRVVLYKVSYAGSKPLLVPECTEELGQGGSGVRTLSFTSSPRFYKDASESLISRPIAPVSVATSTVPTTSHCKERRTPTCLHCAGAVLCFSVNFFQTSDVIFWGKE